MMCKAICPPALGVNSADVICLGTHCPQSLPSPALANLWLGLKTPPLGSTAPAEPPERCPTGGSVLAGRVPQSQRGEPKLANQFFLWMAGPWQQGPRQMDRCWDKGEQRDLRRKKRRGPLAEKGSSRRRAAPRCLRPQRERLATSPCSCPGQYCPPFPSTFVLTQLRLKGSGRRGHGLAGAEDEVSFLLCPQSVPTRELKTYTSLLKTQTFPLITLHVCLTPAFMWGGAGICSGRPYSCGAHYLGALRRPVLHPHTPAVNCPHCGTQSQMSARSKVHVPHFPISTKLKRAPGFLLHSRGAKAHPCCPGPLKLSANLRLPDEGVSWSLLKGQHQRFCRHGGESPE